MYAVLEMSVTVTVSVVAVLVLVLVSPSLISGAIRSLERRIFRHS